MKIESLEDLYLEQLQLLLDAETQVASVLPEMLEACTSEELRDALEEQLETAQEQAARLEKVLARATVRGIAARQTCTGMEGLVREARQQITRAMSSDVRDAAILAAVRRLEHYEIAAYGTARTYATLLNDTQGATLLEQTLEEEKDADRTLTEVAEQVNADLLSRGDLPSVVVTEGIEEAV